MRKNVRTAEHLRLPRAYYDDHVARLMPAPKALSRTLSHVWISRGDVNTRALLDGARRYSRVAVSDFRHPTMRALVQSARATVKTIEAALPELCEPGAAA